MTCPVLSSCYQQLQKHYFPPGGEDHSPTVAFLSYDHSLDDWGELGELIERDDAPTSAHRLRAFYALELVYFFLLPLGSHPVDKVDIKTALQVQRGRDQVGLQDLEQTCESLKRDVVMRTGHTQLLGRGRNPAFELMTASLHSVGKRLDKCAEMAKELRAALGNSCKSKELKRVGHLFGEVLLTNKTPIADSMRHLRDMLNISLENPVSPWNQSTQFQV